MIHFLPTDDPEELRKRWMGRFFSQQAKFDTRLRTVLVQAAEDAYDEVYALGKSSTFSSGVRTAKTRVAISVVRDVLQDLFNETIPLITDGQKKMAGKAADAMLETDRKYLEAAFADSSNATGVSVKTFVDGQKNEAMLGVVNAVQRVTKTEQSLSARVYNTRALSNRWVSRQINSVMVRSGSAKEIAKAVRSSIRPSTPGGVSYAALRLGRTELNNAFHATSISMAENRPWILGMGWHLSSTHVFDPKKPDLCELYDGKVYKIDQTPAKPHPQCRCWVAPEVEPFEMFLSNLTAGHYTDWIENAA